MPIWTGAGADNNWSTGANWDTGVVPNSTTTAIFNGSTGLNPNKNCTITSGANCTDFILTGYSGTITFTNTLTVNMTATAGNITLSASIGFSMVGPNGISYVVNVTATTRTITSNGYLFNLPFAISGLGGSILALTGNFQVSNFTGFNVSINGPGEFRVSGNWSSVAFGTALKVLNGTGTMSTGSQATNLVINAPGFTRTFSGSIFIYNTLLWTAGTIVTTGSTFTGYDMTSVSMGGAGQPLNNLTFSNNIVTTIAFPTDLYVNGNFILPNGANTLNGPGKVFIAGNLSNSGGNSGNLVIELNGTGTVSNAIPLNTIINTTGVVTPASTAIFHGNLTLQSGTVNLANPLRKSGGALIINPAFNFTGSSSLIFQNFDFVNSTHTVTSNGVTWPTSVQISNVTNNSITVTLNDVLTVTGSFTTTAIGAQQLTLNGSNLQVNGNLIISNTNGLIGTSTIVLQGSSNSNWNHTVASPLQNNLTINKSGAATVTIIGTITWGAAGRILQRTAGNINPGTSAVSIPNTISVTINGMIFWNLTMGTTTTLTQNISNTINNNLTLTGSTTFTGTAGWTTNNFTHGGANTTCTLQAGVTYTVNGIFTMIGTAAQRARLQSNDVASVTVSINALSNLMNVTAGSIPNPAAGYVLGSTAFSTALPPALSNIIPDRPTIASGSASPYTLVNPIGTTALTSYAGQVGKKAFFNVTNNGSSSTNVLYAETRDIDSNGGITILAVQTFQDNTATPNLFRTLNWGPLIAPSGSVYYTFVN
jgi:hypothetical protein